MKRILKQLGCLGWPGCTQQCHLIFTGWTNQSLLYLATFSSSQGSLSSLTTESLSELAPTCPCLPFFSPHRFSISGKSAWYLMYRRVHQFLCLSPLQPLCLQWPLTHIRKSSISSGAQEDHSFQKEMKAVSILRLSYCCLCPFTTCYVCSQLCSLSLGQGISITILFSF